MKLRIVYMYENGGNSMLETLLSSESLADFLNQAFDYLGVRLRGDSIAKPEAGLHSLSWNSLR